MVSVKKLSIFLKEKKVSSHYSFKNSGFLRLRSPLKAIFCQIEFKFSKFYKALLWLKSPRLFKSSIVFPKWCVLKPLDFFLMTPYSLFWTWQATFKMISDPLHFLRILCWRIVASILQFHDCLFFTK